MAAVEECTRKQAEGLLELVGGDEVSGGRLELR
jgi:hypothetical protein